MADVLSSTLRLYREAMRATGRSLIHGWIIIIALIAFAVAFWLAAGLARPLGIAGAAASGESGFGV